MPGEQTNAERLRAVEIEIEHLREFKEQAMTMFEELRKDGEMIRAVHEKVQTLGEAPKRTAWWAQSILTIILATGAVIGLLRYGAHDVASAQPITPEVIQQVAEQSAHKAAEEVARQASPTPRETIPATLHAP